ncbi:MAG: hypothetical protein ACK4I8_12085, partial [Armatimonadota bacterium]
MSRIFVGTRGVGRGTRVNSPITNCQLPICQFANYQSPRPAELPTCRLADLPICRTADLPTCRNYGSAGASLSNETHSSVWTETSLQLVLTLAHQEMRSKELPKENSTKHDFLSHLR